MEHLHTGREDRARAREREGGVQTHIVVNWCAHPRCVRPRRCVCPSGRGAPRRSATGAHRAAHLARADPRTPPHVLRPRATCAPPRSGGKSAGPARGTVDAGAKRSAAGPRRRGGRPPLCQYAPPVPDHPTPPPRPPSPPLPRLPYHDWPQSLSPNWLLNESELHEPLSLGSWTVLRTLPKATLFPGSQQSCWGLGRCTVSRPGRDAAAGQQRRTGPQQVRAVRTSCGARARAALGDERACTDASRAPALHCAGTRGSRAPSAAWRSRLSIALHPAL